MDHYTAQRMKFLLCMRDCLANANAANQIQELQDLRNQRANLTEQFLALRQAIPFQNENLTNLDEIYGTLSRVNSRINELEKVNWNANENPHLAGRIRALFLCHLVVAPFLEVEDVQTATMATDLRVNHGWTGTACINNDIPIGLRQEIVQQLNEVPHRFFHMILGVPVFADGN